MAEQVYVTNLNCNDLRVTGTVTGPKRSVENITNTTTVLTEANSGTVFTINVPENAASTITLPAITASNIGCTYEFVVLTENTGGIDILTASTSDTEGDVFVGALSNLPSIAEAAAILHVIPGADDNKLTIDTGLTNGGGKAGTYIECTAVSYSATGHSQWLVTGQLGTADANSTGAAIFTDRD
jgi:hypothetical protein